MTGFLEAPRFPNELAFWAEGGSGYNTTVITLLSGFEQRNINWAYARGKWNMTQECLVLPANERLLISFFNVVRGMGYGFRFKDWRDFQDWGGGIFGVVSTSPSIVFQMQKLYSPSGASGVSPLFRPIRKPILAPPGGQAFQMYRLGVLLSSGAGVNQYTLDATTGLVTMGAGSDASAGNYTWVGEFDVACRFDVDQISVWREPEGGFLQWKSIPILEIRT